MSHSIPRQTAPLLAKALAALVGKPEKAKMIFLRCLPAEIARALIADDRFDVTGWVVRLVGDENVPDRRKIQADAAVAAREDKGDAMILLVDVQRAGAGMDGIYTAATEVHETELFDEGCKEARKQVGKISRAARNFADAAIKKAERQAKPQGLAPWLRFRYWCEVLADESGAEADCNAASGAALPTLGLWPVAVTGGNTPKLEDIESSARLVERLLPMRGAGQGTEERVEALNLPDEQEEQKADLVRLLREVDRLPRPEALARLGAQPGLQLNALRPGIFTERSLERIEWSDWRLKSGKLASWSGLTQDEGQDYPELQLSLDIDNPKARKSLEVRWQCFPDSLKKGSVDFVVEVVVGESVLASHSLSHSGKQEQKCSFSPEDFSDLPESSRLTAKVEIRAVGQESSATDDAIGTESEYFVICIGVPEEDQPASTAGIVYPTLALAAIQVAPDIDAWNRLVSEPDGEHFKFDKGHICCQFKEKGRTRAARVFCPPLIQRLADDWYTHNGQPGRWKVAVRVDGSEASPPEFIPNDVEGSEGERFIKISKAFADKLKSGRGPLGVLYGDAGWITDYVNAATAWWESEQATPVASLIHTLEVVNQNGKTQGVIVLPTHPLRVAWQQGFDQLAMFHRYEEGQSPRTVAKLLEGLVSTHFPAFLPGVAVGETLVFGDSLGFHAAAMVRADDREPKTTVALLSRLLGGGAGSDDAVAPTVGRGAADLLATEIGRYLTLHPDAQRVLVQAIGAGDGLTVARALGKALDELAEAQSEGAEDVSVESHPEIAFELDFHAVGDHRAEWSGRFLAATAEKGRNSPSRVLQQDRWLLESVQRPGGVTLPRLKWARRDQQQPEGAAHLALVFDAFPSSVVAVPAPDFTGSLEVHGLALSPDRQFEVKQEVATWRVQVPTKFDGEKHPVIRMLSERLVKSHAAVLVSVARWLGGGRESWPVLMTYVSPKLEELFGKLHRQCNWVITADRNAGVEYFDSPEALSEVYDAYLIDCVPERDDLGFLQLITSTACLDEVIGIFAEALGGMGLSSSPTNCSFLLNALKALSGRLALRLPGSGMVVQEMIALALTQSNCMDPHSDHSKWPSLSEGFFVPLDDVPDLLKPGQLKKLDAKTGDEAERRADLLYVTAEKRGGLRFAFYEVKYRNTLRSARNQDLCERMQGQLDASCKRWDAHFGEGISTLERTLRRASLAKTLRFYAAKAQRHGLSEDAFVRISREIERMLREPSTVTIPSMVQATDTRQGFVFCPEYAGKKPDELAHVGDAKLWLFGPDLLPDGSGATPDSIPDEPTEISLTPVPEQTTRQEVASSLNTVPAVEPVAEQIVDPKETSKVVINLGAALPGEAPVEWVVGTNGGNPHLLIVGQPGMGKTHCLIRVCQQLHEQGIVPIVFSFHQDIDEKLMATVPGGVQTVSYEGLGFNPMEVIATHPQAYVESVDMLRDVFSAIFPDLGEVQLGSLRKALKKSYEDQGWASEGSRGKTPGFGDFLGILQATPKVDQKMLNRLEELADYGFFSVQSGSPSLLDATRPTLVQIHSRQNDTLQRAFATFVLYNIYQSMFKRGPLSHLTHAIVFDEAHRAAKLKLIPTMAKECRKFGLSLILASQEIKDFDQSLFANVSNSLTLRLLEADAQRMAKNFGIPYDKVKLYADRIKQMPKFQALFNREGLREPVKVALGA